MSFFPANPTDGDEIGPNANGTHFKYVDADNKWIIISDINISDVAYNEATWDANSDAATKNAIRDKIESMSGVSQADFDAAMAFGIGNKRWATWSYEGAQTAANINVSVAYQNTNATDSHIVLTCPLPFIKNGKNLTITQLRITIADSDANDYVTRIRMFGHTGTATQDTLADIDHDSVSGTGVGTFTHDIADATVGGLYKRLILYVQYVATTANDLDIWCIEYEYYYA